ncbi:MAG TPA: nicotinamide-nucleotide amidohydrolase family protein [Planctomycetota bacterium]|jgi:nicotinamide-nucleotide amidase
MSKASLLSIGDELLLGEIIDTNMPYIARQLLPLGITVVGSETACDEMDVIVGAFDRALRRADIVIATGGLGPTDDDLTLEALARALGVELTYRPEVMQQMAERLKRSVESFTQANHKQAWLPKGAAILRNHWGTAPGVHVSVVPNGTAWRVLDVAQSSWIAQGSSAIQEDCVTGAKHIFLTAGVPREMKGLLQQYIVPYLSAHFRSGQALAIKLLHTFGLPESFVGERIKPMMQPGHNPNVGTRLGAGIVSVRLVASAPNAEQAQAILAPAAQQIRELLRDGLFGEDDETLAAATVGALLSHKKTIALAESCTAGLVSALLTEISGSSAALLEGAVVYSNEAKVRTCGVKPETLTAHGAVSAETAAELAAGIRARAGTDFGVSVTGIAGPTGATATKPIGLVYFGVATAKEVTTLERNYPGMDRATVRERAAMQALDLIRRAALGE